MNRNRIVIALIAVAVIAALVLLRQPLKAVFSPNPEAKEMSDAQSAFEQSKLAVKQAESALEESKMQIQTQEDTYNKAIRARDEAEERLIALGEAPEEESNSDDLLKVEVIRSASEDIASGIALSGKVEAARKLEVRAETSGQVISEPIASGTAVRKDDILCELDPGTRQASLSQAIAGLDTARTQYNSTLSLKNRGLASTAALQAANASLEQAQSAVDNAEREIQRLKIRAPFDGVLENQTSELGSLLQPGAVCASIIALDRLLLVGYASESQVGKIQKGAKARGILRNGENLDGEVTFVAATSDPVTRTYRVEVSVVNPGDVRDGGSARITIALAGTQGHLIPQNALTLNDEGDLGVKVYDEGMAVFKPVEMVRDTPDGIWVTGLEDEADIIIEGQEYAVDGQQVEAVFKDGSSS